MIGLICILMKQNNQLALIKSEYIKSNKDK